jgi:hypothetical protein
VPFPGQTGFETQQIQLFPPDGKGIFPRIDQQNQVVPGFQFLPYVPVGFPSDPPGPVPVYRVPEFTGKGKGNTVPAYLVFPQEKLRPGTAYHPAPVKNLPYFIPSL